MLAPALDLAPYLPFHRIRLHGHALAALGLGLLTAKVGLRMALAVADVKPHASWRRLVVAEVIGRAAVDAATERTAHQPLQEVLVLLALAVEPGIAVEAFLCSS